MNAGTGTATRTPNQTALTSQCLVSGAAQDSIQHLELRFGSPGATSAGSPIKPICGNNHCCNPLHWRAKGVPHYHVNRHMQKIDLEFSSNKLQHETQLFLETTLERDPKRFEKLQKANKLWIDFRLNSDKPVQIEDLIKAAAKEQGFNP